ILGICGTFMGGVAVLARQLGFKVTGSDLGVYPPMSTYLESEGITITQGYDPAQLEPKPDLVVIGNAMTRGNPCVERVLNTGLAFTSGPEFIKNYILKDRWVIAVAGTHGKTTTTGMIAWILEDNGLDPGFLIGGIPGNFPVSARLGTTPFFVIEADEYDTAFFDKRSKFVHYLARTAVLNNLEFDHADIFPDLEAIIRQFHHFVRILPGEGLVIHNAADASIARVLGHGCWSQKEGFAAPGPSNWSSIKRKEDASQFEVLFGDSSYGSVNWDLIGDHNMNNAMAAIAAARHVGVSAENAVDSLSRFRNAKRRLEVRGVVKGITVYDDFAHHPTAIASTIQGLRRKVGGQRIVAVLEPRSNTMRLGVHAHNLVESFNGADHVMFYQPPEMAWDIKEISNSLGDRLSVFNKIENLISALCANTQSGEHILIMSNGGFENLHNRLLQALEQ
ncbi:MAG: UDP-N-acetylmuramate:L-alanyl-gamma-D-glutamyl-meso-diaminopimelate ligase, partial [Gammaproteobacteria bacterium]|nr:UDP-N-acetylmuramate:L-alanyl-gamma-D-glutamyl-meso-diaminopimelate ligase [Gammaproteobacteria bacterium]